MINTPAENLQIPKEVHDPHQSKLTELYLKLALHEAIFLATCLAIALRDKLKVDCSVQHVLFATYLATFLGLQRLHRVSSSYMMQFSLQIVSQRSEKTPTANCRRHVTRCNFDLQLAMDSKESLQSLKK